MSNSPDILAIAKIEGFFILQQYFDVFRDQESCSASKPGILAIDVRWANNACLQPIVGGVHDFLVDHMVLGRFWKIVDLFDLLNIVPNVRVVFSFPSLLSFVGYAACSGQMNEETRVLVLRTSGQNCLGASWVVDVSGICGDIV